MTDDLKKQRAAIDAIDERIVALLNERASHARAIGELKGGTPAYRPEREAEVLRHVSALNGPLAPERVAAIFSEIISACRALEQPMAVAYLGPEGTFSEMAMFKHFGHGIQGLPAGSIDEVFRRVEDRSVHHAVVPVENSTEGAIGRTLDLLLTTQLKICGEVVLRVRQNLLAKSGGLRPPHVYARVYSHPQSLGQCHAWLAQNLPGAERVPVSSNAEAARRAAEESDACAIGPELAAERYGLAVAARSIEDDPRNMTRFLVLGWNEAGPSGRDRTSIVMSAANRPGAMHELISPFARHGVSMSRIESRPARTGQWEYLFYVDLEGHLSEPRVAQALAELKQKAPFVKVFGSYPAADF